MTRIVRLAVPPSAPTVGRRCGDVIFAQPGECFRGVQYFFRTRLAADQEIRLGRITRHRHKIRIARSRAPWHRLSCKTGNRCIGRQCRVLVTQVHRPTNGVRSILEAGVRRAVTQQQGPAPGHRAADAIPRGQLSLGDLQIGFAVGRPVARRPARPIAGPKLIVGTNLPSMTSRWIASAPACSTARTSSSR